ncbi:DUF6414 family protein [Haloglomus salinum]|uniref:DUF6414 family protein n=1 Tax=Haloglomus salinum TaxID=2962673 RepID=UPI0020CA1AEE|nr:hypothetical protein [Haloglomus salinum]
MSRLREFIHINDESLNSSLSSLGRGVPSEVTHSVEGESERSGQAGGTIWGIGAKGEYSGLNRDAIETRLEVSAPYRFQDLLNQLEEDNIDIYDNPDPRSVARGDVVRISGEANPMSMFKFEVVIKTFRELLNTQMRDNLIELDEAPQEPMGDDVNLGQLQVLQDLIEQFTGDKLPLRMEGENYRYGVALDREDMRVPAPGAFLNEPEYTLFGRVEERIVGEDSWDPILAMNIMDKYLPQETAGEEMREALEEAAEEMNIPMEPEDWEIPSQTAIIHPIAMFW